MQQVIIVGNAELGSIMYQYLVRDGRYSPAGFAADREHIACPTLHELPVLELEAVLGAAKYQHHTFLIAVGYSNLLRGRESMFRRIQAAHREVLQYIHPDAKVYSSHLGEGVIVMPNAVVDVGAIIGNNSVVWANGTVAHGAVVAENCWLASGAVLSGNCRVGCNTFVGVNASVTNHVSVGRHNIIGANALVAKSTSDHEVTLCGQRGKYRLNSDQFVQLTKL